MEHLAIFEIGDFPSFIRLPLAHHRGSTNPGIRFTFDSGEKNLHVISSDLRAESSGVLPFLSPDYDPQVYSVDGANPDRICEGIQEDYSFEIPLTHSAKTEGLCFTDNNTLLMIGVSACIAL